jgi:hypothetical protein
VSTCAWVGAHSCWYALVTVLCCPELAYACLPASKQHPTSQSDFVKLHQTHMQLQCRLQHVVCAAEAAKNRFGAGNQWITLGFKELTWGRGSSSWAWALSLFTIPPHLSHVVDNLTVGLLYVMHCLSRSYLHCFACSTVVNMEAELSQPGPGHHRSLMPFLMAASAGTHCCIHAHLQHCVLLNLGLDNTLKHLAMYCCCLTCCM